MKWFGLLLLCFITLQGCTRLEVELLGNNRLAGKYASIRGFNMYYEIYGEGEPLLFIHGNGGSMRVFKEQARFFSKKYKLIFVDSRAQGKSVDTSDSLSYETMADDFNALLNHLKIDSCNVIGWSDGGINALLLAMRHPEKVKKLVSTGANLWPDSTALVPWLVKDLKNTVATKKPITVEEKNSFKLTKMMVGQPNIKLVDLKMVNCPALIIGGDRDLILPTHTVAIADAIPKSYLWILPNCGHSTLIDYKDEFNKVVLDFFKKPFTKG